MSQRDYITHCTEVVWQPTPAQRHMQIRTELLTSVTYKRLRAMHNNFDICICFLNTAKAYRQRKTHYELGEAVCQTHKL